MMVVPVYFAYQQLWPGPGSSVVGEDRILLEQAVGSWPVTLVEEYSPAPSSGGQQTWSKDYELRICDACADTLKAAFISNEQPTRPAYGEIFSGGPTVFHSQLSFSGYENKQTKIWLTLEGWDGEVRQVSIP